MPHKADTTVICQCGAMTYVCMYACMYVCVCVSLDVCKFRVYVKYVRLVLRFKV